MRALIVGLCLAALSWAQLAEVHNETLQNGMKILIQEDHNIPNVAMYFFFRIGSRNEHPGTTGLSHFFEHMMFNGAKKYGPKQFDNQMEKNGGNNNAYTTEDTTVYTDWFPRSALELMMDMESDRIRDLSFDPKIVESERGVVYSERRLSVDNSNFGVLYEQLGAAAYVAHPYHWPVIGWPSDIESWTMDDLKTHFRMGYAPNNCVMVVVGGVSNAEVMGLAKKYLEPIPRQEPPPPVRTKEPEQLGEKRVMVRKRAQLPIELVAYHVPETRSADDAPLDVLETLLVHGQSSRLYNRMVDKEQLVLNVNARRQNSLDPGLLVFNLSPRTGVEPARAEKALFEELDRLRNEPISEQELRKAKNQLLADHYRQLKTIAGRANLLGIYEVYHGDYRKLFTVEQTLEAVTAAKSLKDNPQGAMGSYFQSFFFGASHPYGHPADEITLARLTRQDIVDYHQSMYCGRNLVVIVTGDFDPSVAGPKLAEAFGGVAAGKPFAWPAAAPVRSGGELLLVDKPDATQTYFYIGQPGIDRKNPDRITLLLVNTLFGGRFTSMLNDELRVNSGLTYGASCQVQEPRLAGGIVIATFTKTETTAKAIDMALDVLKRLWEKGITAEQLSSAKAHVKGTYPPARLQTADQLAAILGDLELYGQERDEVDDFFARIDAVTLDRANAAARKYYKADNLTFVVLGNAAKIRESAGKYAPKVVEVAVGKPGFGGG